MGHYLDKHHNYEHLAHNDHDDNTSPSSTLITFSRRQRFSDILKPALIVQFIFGLSNNLQNSITYLCLSKLLLVFWMGGVCAIFAMAVFHRKVCEDFSISQVSILLIVWFKTAWYILYILQCKGAGTATFFVLFKKSVFCCNRLKNIAGSPHLK